MTSRENPFRTDRLERILTFDPELIGTNWQEIEKRWHSLKRECCVWGHHGAGKTTFLEAFRDRLQQKDEILSLFFNTDEPRFSKKNQPNCSGKIVLVDGDQHLKWRDRLKLRHFLKPARRVLFARHHPGRLDVLLELKSDPELAEQLLQRIDSNLKPDLPALFHEKKGNLREIWLKCYDLAGCSR